MTSAYSSSTAHRLGLAGRRGDGHDLLGEHVERVARHHRRSIAPSRIRRATTAHSSRSARNLGKMRPRLTSPTEWPARPIRCRPAGHRLRRLDLDDQVDGAHVDAELEAEVATRQGSSPALSISSTTVRSSRASEPWWARRSAARREASPSASASARSFRRSARRSAPRRLLTKMIVERCARTSSSSSG